MTFNNPDFVKYAESYGAKGTRAVPIDYSENTRVLVDELRERLPVAPSL
jgi:acetolactate synthase-1/2/3 large subunit